MFFLSIEARAFGGCTRLTSVTIPDSVTIIGIWAFAACTGLTKAYFYGNAPSMGQYVFDDCASNFTVCYTAGSTGFTTPMWDGYPTAVCATSSTTTVPSTNTTTTPSTTTTTVPAHQCAAEAIYGKGSEETELLREYRDKVLSKSATGRQTIKTYYELSPAVSEVLQKNDTARASARRMLDSLMPVIREKVKQ
ncbi:MAG: leucine-rich repeat protein [Proteobacteria bacterium]|nr:leucine-rich repeat protein [Pseudomonadota bacterium]